MWPISEFHTPWNTFGTAKASVVKFCVLAGYISCTNKEWWWSSVSLPMTNHLWKGCGPGRVILSEFYTPLNFFGMTEDRIVKFCARVGPRSACLVMTNFPQMCVVKITWRLNFWQISVNISKTVQDSDIVTMSALSNSAIFNYLWWLLTAPNHPIFYVLQRLSYFRNGWR